MHISVAAPGWLADWKFGMHRFISFLLLKGLAGRLYLHVVCCCVLLCLPYLQIVQIVFKLTSDGYEKAIGHSSVVSEGFCAVESLGGMKEEANYEKSSLQKCDLIKDEVCKEGNYGKSSPCKAVCAIEVLGGIKEELLMKDEICKEGNCQKFSLYNEMDSNTYLLKQDTVAKGNKKMKVLPAYKKLKASSLRRRLVYLPYIEPVVWQGKFSVPLSALTGKSAIDDKNLGVSTIFV